MWKDDAYLLDMLLAAKKVVAFKGDIDEAAFHRDEILQHAVMRLLTIIGEAANKVSIEMRAEHPEIPWRAIIGMRNRLVHDYLGIDLVQVWEIVQIHIPVLIALIEPIVPTEGGGDVTKP